MKLKILVLHGVNLNMFGRRDPAVYGKTTLEEINARLEELANELGVKLDFFQTNSEGALIDRIHASLDENYDAVLINAGAWTHYSHAIADALAILTVPVIEVHMSHIHARESFRHESVLSPVVAAAISGFGCDSYLLALRGAYGMVLKSSS